MNVLIYYGPEVLQTSLTRSTSLLKSALFPNYAVQPITEHVLLTGPWPETCALLVIPACREQLSLPPAARTRIKTYVEGGGTLLGLRSSARISRFSSLDLYESSLRFQDRSSGTSLSCTFTGSSENDTSLVSVKSVQGDTSTTLPAPSEAPEELTIPNNSTTTEVLAHYDDDDTQVAALSCRLGGGKVVLWGVDLFSTLPPSVQPQAEQGVRVLLNESLQSLGLKLPEKEIFDALPLLPQFLTSSPNRPDIVPKIMTSLSLNAERTLKDENDTFAFYTAAETEKVLQQARSSSSPPGDAVKNIIFCEEGTLILPSETPSFNISQYYADLAVARSKAGLPPVEGDKWGIGEALLYGEVVTSTQTMLDKNHRFVSSLPHPLLSIASHQIAGRGRSLSNQWVSPSGCLQFSLLLRAPLSQLPAQRLVFIQYLFAIAVVEACRDPAILGSLGEHIRIKWPNDVYLVQGEQKRKVGGILVHTSFQGGLVTVIIGCGINVLNDPPIASLAQIGTPPHPLSMECTAATIMAIFEPMWNKFVSERGSFSSFMDLYLERWLHSDQLVTITTTTPHKLVRIIGITEDHGLLRTLPERSGNASQFIDLRPDGNSFDIMSGLIMSKT